MNSLRSLCSAGQTVVEVVTLGAQGLLTTQTIETLDLSTLVPFPTFNGSRFRELLDEEMGYPEPTKVS